MLYVVETWQLFAFFFLKDYRVNKNNKLELKHGGKLQSTNTLFPYWVIFIYFFLCKTLILYTNSCTFFSSVLLALKGNYLRLFLVSLPTFPALIGVYHMADRSRRNRQYRGTIFAHNEPVEMSSRQTSISLRDCRKSVKKNDIEHKNKMLLWYVKMQTGLYLFLTVKLKGKTKSRLS